MSRGRFIPAMNDGDESPFFCKTCDLETLVPEFFGFITSGRGS
jgi:hypothetical protein